MKKAIFVFLILLCSCSRIPTPTSVPTPDLARQRIIYYLNSLMNINLQVQENYKEFKNITGKLGKSNPTKQDVNDLFDRNQKFVNLFNQFSAITPPDEAKDIKNGYLKCYDLFINYSSYYLALISTYDVSNYAKSTEADFQANSVCNDAADNLLKLANKYLITCEQLNNCERNDNQ